MTEPISPIDELSDRMRAVEDRLLVMSGQDGTNGKVGTLRRDFDEDRSSRRGWLATLAGGAATALVTGVTALIIAAREDGAMERTIEFMQAQAAVMRADLQRTGSELAIVQLELSGLRASLPVRRSQNRNGDDK